MPLQTIDSKHLAALESELARVTAQRDALRDAALQFVVKSGNSQFWNAVELDLCRKIARDALQACQD